MYIMNHVSGMHCNYVNYQGNAHTCIVHVHVVCLELYDGSTCACNYLIVYESMHWEIFSCSVTLMGTCMYVRNYPDS